MVDVAAECVDGRSLSYTTYSQRRTRRTSATLTWHTYMKRSAKEEFADNIAVKSVQGDAVKPCGRTAAANFFPPGLYIMYVNEQHKSHTSDLAAVRVVCMGASLLESSVYVQADDFELDSALMPISMAS